MDAYLELLAWSTGGAERQCRFLGPYLKKEGVIVTVITAWLSYDYHRRELDGASTVIRLGIFAPLFRIFVRAVTQLNNRLFGGFYSNAGDEGAKGINYWISVPFVWVSRLLFIAELFVWGYFHRNAVDCIHVHETGWLGAVGVLLGRCLNKPVVCKAATTPVFPVLGWDVPFRFLLRMHQKSPHIILLNDFAKEELIREGWQNEDYSVIPNAVRLPAEQAYPAKSDMVLYVGNLCQGAYLKGFDVLFGAWSIVANKNRKAKLVVAGAGDTSGWKKVLQELGCVDSVKFTGFIDNLEPYFLQAGMFVLPSRVEGMSNALLEACSYGVPVIISDIPANKAVIERSDAGVLVEQENPEALAEAIIDCLDKPTIRIEMGKHGRALIEMCYQGNQVAAQLSNLYAKLVDNHGCQK